MSDSSTNRWLPGSRSAALSSFCSATTMANVYRADCKQRCAMHTGHQTLCARGSSATV